MTKLARTIHFDESDTRIFEIHAETGEWAISGGFEFSNWEPDDLTGKKRQAFANGWLGLSTFGRATFVAVAQIEEHELERLAEALAAHFVHYYGAPGIEAALPAAREELAYMAELCDDHDPNTLLVVTRELTDAGVKEQFRHIQPREAELDQVAVHVTED
jgi:hypothetical protein